MKDGKLEAFVPMTLRRQGAQRLVQQPVVEEREAHDSTLIKGMGRAFHWQRLLNTCRRLQAA